MSSLDPERLAESYGQMVETPKSNVEGMDPITGDYIRPQPSEVFNKPKEEEEQPKESNRRKQSKSSRKELRRQLSRRIMKTLNAQRKEDAEGEDEGANNCIFGHQIRFTIMAISTLCLSSILSNILTFNFTFICMAGDRPLNYSLMSDLEKTESGYREDLDYSSVERSALFMAVAVGALMAVFPLTVALNKFGSRMVFGLLGLLSAISTYLIPLSANIGFPAMVVMRVLQGASFSACLPVMGSITSHWSTLKQNGIFIAILSSFLQIAPIFTMPLAAELCVSDLGWPSVYYIHGTISILLFAIFIFYHRNSPQKHPLMRRRELVKVWRFLGKKELKVMFGKGGSIYGGASRSKASKKVPYRDVFRDINIWAILVAAFGNFMGTQLSLQFMPTYINKVLYLPIEQTGMASAISPIIMFVIKLVSGQTSDKITFISDPWKLRIYNTLSCGLMGLLFIVLGILDPREQQSLCLIVLITSTCILGFNSGGFYKSSQMVSRQHSHFTLALISFLNCVCMLIVPLLNEVIAPENEPEDWATVLWIHAVCLLVTNFFFCIFCSAKAAKWTMDGWSARQSRRSRRDRVVPSA